MDIKTPGPVVVDVVFPNGSGQGVFNFSPDFDPRWNSKFEKAQKFIDSEVLSLCEPRVPKRNGILIASGTMSTEIGSGTVIYATPYARRWYYADGSKVKFTGAPARGPKWFERMKAEDGADIQAGVQKILYE